MYNGTGLVAFLHATPLIDVGLFQLYAAMTVIGVVLLIGSFQSKTWVWNLIGFVVQITPLLSNFIFADLYKHTGISPSWALHSMLLFLEFLALLTLFFEYNNRRIIPLRKHALYTSIQLPIIRVNVTHLSFYLSFFLLSYRLCLLFL